MTATRGTRVLVFARAPVAGRCKTRLIPRYGARGAAALHRELVERTLATAKRSGLEVELWCEPSVQHAHFARWRREFGVVLRRQPAGDLGRKMSLALRSALREGAPAAIVIGTDCPGLEPADLRAAAAALADSGAVIQPAFDGGYVLIGARVDFGSALRGIHWSSGREGKQTLDALRRRGWTCALLELRCDVDHPADVRRARADGLL